MCHWIMTAHHVVFVNTFSAGAVDSSYQRLSDDVSGNIFTIGANVSSLEQALRQIGTNRDSLQLRNKLHDIETSTNSIVQRTTSDLRQLSARLPPTPDSRACRLQWQRLTGEFKEVTQRYHNIQKETVSDESERLEQRQLLIQDETIDLEVSLIHEREVQIRQLEADVLDVNQIFRDLGMLIHEQGQVIDTIEANVTSASDHVDDGRQQLHKAAVYQALASTNSNLLSGS